MQTPLEKYYLGRLEQVSVALRKNNFAVHVVEDSAQAKDLVLGTLIPESGAKSAAFGGSMTLADTGIYAGVKSLSGLEVLDTYDKTLPPAEMIELRRKALLVDLFLMGTNAVTEQGTLVNLDGTGNRVAALTFGPKKVIIVVGRNKLCTDEYDAMERVRELAAPVNAIRLSRKTPCAKTLRCEDCSSPERICNTWVITKKSSIEGRITVVLVNQDLGF